MVCICTTQQDRIPQSRRTDLEREIRSIAQETIGSFAIALRFVWVEVASGSGYTAGEPSTTSVIGMSVPDGTVPHSRESLIAGVCNAWSRITRCSVNEVVVTAVDESVLQRAV